MAVKTRWIQAMTGSDTAHVGYLDKGAAATDALGEITIENYPSSPAIKERKDDKPYIRDAGEIVQTPDFGVASEPVSVLGAQLQSHVSQILYIGLRVSLIYLMILTYKR